MSGFIFVTERLSRNIPGKSESGDAYFEKLNPNDIDLKDYGANKAELTQNLWWELNLIVCVNFMSYNSGVVSQSLCFVTLHSSANSSYY